MKDKVIFTFPNTHQAITAETVLAETEIPATVMPVPPSIHTGCGLCLAIPRDFADAAERSLMMSEVVIQQKYDADKVSLIEMKG